VIEIDISNNNLEVIDLKNFLTNTPKLLKLSIVLDDNDLEAIPMEQELSHFD
jgi:hypothetical protein